MCADDGEGGEPLWIGVEYGSRSFDVCNALETLKKKVVANCFARLTLTRTRETRRVMLQDGVLSLARSMVSLVVLCFQANSDSPHVLRHHSTFMSCKLVFE